MRRRGGKLTGDRRLPISKLELWTRRHTRVRLVRSARVMDELIISHDGSSLGRYRPRGRVSGARQGSLPVLPLPPTGPRHRFTRSSPREPTQYSKDYTEAWAAKVRRHGSLGVGRGGPIRVGRSMTADSPRSWSSMRASVLSLFLPIRA